MHKTIARQTAPIALSKPLADNRDVIYRLSLSFLALTLLVLLPDNAYAGDPLSRTICLVVGWFTQGMGQAIATLGIIVLGIGAMLGKVSWQMALTVAFGVSVMFSGARVVELLTAHDASFCVGDAGFSSGYIEAVLCRVAELANSPTGRALSTVAIAILGVSALMGKLSAGLAVTLAVGIGIMHGAEEIGQSLVTAMGGAWIACSPVAA